ncbi:MAG: rhodanese-like domain-containing protein, partial [Caldilineaceae bacterium]|nr:rhodanese-like domain-containing protein [Caldilineaceae bacterium]
MKKLVFAIAIFTFGMLTACNAPAPANVAESAEPAAAAVELNLPDVVDAQTAASVQDRDDVLLIDVREQWEYDEGHIPNITLIPMNEVPARLSEIPTDKEVIVA